MKSVKTKLSERQRLFIDFMPQCNWIIRQAGMKAGYTEKYATHRLPAVMLSNVAVKEALALKRAKISAKTGVKVEQIVQGLSELAWPSGDRHVKDPDRLRALELLGRHKAMFTDKTEHTVRASGPPSDPEDRIKWLEEELVLLREAQAAPSAIVRA